METKHRKTSRAPCPMCNRIGQAMWFRTGPTRMYVKHESIRYCQECDIAWRVSVI